jgi:hypothetical protein
VVVCVCARAGALVHVCVCSQNALWCKFTLCIPAWYFQGQSAYCFLYLLFLSWRGCCYSLLLIPSEAATYTFRGCYLYLKRLLLIPSEAATYTLRGCYLFLQRLLLIPSEAATYTLRGCYLYLQRLLLIPSEAATYSFRGCYLYLQRLLLIP